MFRWWVWTVVALVCSLTPDAAAQAVMVADNPAWNSLRFSGTQEIHVRTKWTSGRGGRSAKVTLAPRGAAKPVTLHQGKSVLTDVAIRNDVALVAMIHGGAQPFVRLTLSKIGAAATARPTVVRVARKPQGDYRPASVVATADRDGFAVLWQEHVVQNMRTNAKTFMVRVAPNGRILRAPSEVAIPWGMGAMVYNGRGYHLALYFDGGGPGQTRLSLVTLSADGRPEQHPWWASPQGNITDVHLVRAQGRVLAFFRGGADGSQLQSTDVTAVGQWGREPQAPRSHGRIGSDEEFGVLVSSRGVPGIVRRSSREFR